jgi:hypothetical protein
VARAARENPVLLEMLRDGRLHLSGMARLAPHLTRQNSEAVLKRASGCRIAKYGSWSPSWSRGPMSPPASASCLSVRRPTAGVRRNSGRPELSLMLSTSSRGWPRRPAHRS